MTNRITDAIECFHQMDNGLAGETTRHDEQLRWAVGERLSGHACCVCVTCILQISSSVAPKSWNTLGTSQQRPDNTMKPLLNIQLPCLSTQSSPEIYS